MPNKQNTNPYYKAKRQMKRKTVSALRKGRNRNEANQRSHRQDEPLYYMAARKLGVKDNSLLLYYVLSDEKAHSQKEISEEWMVPRTTLNTVVKEAVEKGYIRLETPGSTREKTLILTEKGKLYAASLLNRVFAAEEQALERTLREFSSDLMKGMEVFTDYMQEEFQKEIFGE